MNNLSYLLGGKLLKDWFKKNSSAVSLFTFLFLILILFIFFVKEIVLTCSVLFMIFALIFVYFAREKEDEVLNVRTNALLIKFYVKTSFFLIVISTILVFIYIAHFYWAIINIVRM